MTQPARKVQWAVWGGLGIITLAILAAFLFTQAKGKPLPVLGEMISFSLTNQNGQSVTLDNFDGEVWIADAIFTRCPGQCLVMTAHMKEIQDALPPHLPIQLASFTTDPDFDRPPVLKIYADRVKADSNVWSFLTGPKSELHNAEIEGLKLAVLDKPAAEKESPNDLFIHSEKFVLLDKQGRIRGWYDGEQPGTVGVLLSAAKRLAAE